MKNFIYTPQTGSNPFPAQFSIGDMVTVTNNNNGQTRTGRVSCFPTNSANDTDHRMHVLPTDAIWFGSVTVSMENNSYGNWHISEVTIAKN